MKRLLPIFLAASLCAVAGAQDLDTVNFVDQLNSGSRGNLIEGTGVNYGAALPDGSEYLDYTGPDLSGTATYIRYINSWTTDSNIVESPILDVTTAHTNPDRSNALAILPPNNRPGATDGNTAVFIGDDGGYNALWFGETDSQNYYASVDLYCKVFTPSDNLVEFIGLSVRGGRNEDPETTETEVYDYAFSPDRDGSYCLFYDAHQNKFRALKWTIGVPKGDVEGRVASGYTEFASLALEDSGWHTIQIIANGDNIKFSVDGTELISVTDTEFTNGRGGIYYREAATPSANEMQGVFDNLRAGPASEANVVDWTMY